MKLELKLARGWRIWVDGKEPVGEWEIGESDADNDGMYEISQNRKPLQVGPYAITAIGFDVDQAEWCDDLKPTQVIVESMVNGEIWSRALKITKIVWGDSDGTVCQVQLVNGTTLKLDEITAYVRAEGTR